MKILVTGDRNWGKFAGDASLMREVIVLNIGKYEIEESCPER